ncbi:uncharacterized protein LOC121238198 [Juglans microcarpa x Juglans regia]|uniref:uncharacterized protein LOC121238198 n=1 Tax=Juglans microcarpa x Juglans regia TaxID=2249226 RepID=UPI001B7EEF2C|nr:uncharacterized protein LOC121238198 [Juglans microcarpa x Juglans regia]
MQQLVAWEKPSRVFVKVNCDASLDIKRKRMRIEIMIRDGEGEALVDVCDHKTNVGNATVTESFALRKVVELYLDLNIQNAIFEGDAKGVIEAVHSEDEAVFDFSSIIEDVKFHFRIRTDWFLQFATRKKNMIAHTLAKKALEMVEEQVWIEEVLGCLFGDTNCNT